MERALGGGSAGGSGYTRTHPLPRTRIFAGPPRTTAHFLPQKSKETAGVWGVGGCKKFTASQDASSFKSQKGGKKKKKGSSNAGPREAERLLLAFLREPRAEVPGGAGPGSVVPWLGPAAGRPSRPRPLAL